MAPLLLLSWPTTAGGMRRLDVVVVHQTLHRMFARTSRRNRVVGDVISTLLWRPPYHDNHREHRLHHAFPGSLRDGDTLYLQSTGVRPGMTKREFHRYLVRALLSPRHHWSFLSSRIRGNLSRRQPVDRMIGLAVYAAGLVVALSEHGWWLFDNAERLTKAQRDQLTFGRFCGVAVPDPAGPRGLRRAAAWT